MYFHKIKCQLIIKTNINICVPFTFEIQFRFVIRSMTIIEKEDILTNNFLYTTGKFLILFCV